VGIDLRGRKALVSEQLLDHAQVRTAFEQMGRVRVSKGVGVDVSARDPVVQDAPYVARTKSIAPSVEEQRLER